MANLMRCDRCGHIGNPTEFHGLDCDDIRFHDVNAAYKAVSKKYDLCDTCVCYLSGWLCNRLKCVNNG